MGLPRKVVWEMVGNIIFDSVVGTVPVLGDFFDVTWKANVRNIALLLTFGLFKEHKQWKQFRESSNTEMEFLHRDEFEQKYARKFEYPVILKKEDNDLRAAIAQAELNQIQTLDELISQVKIVSELPTSK